MRVRHGNEIFYSSMSAVSGQHGLVDNIQDVDGRDTASKGQFEDVRKINVPVLTKKIKIAAIIKMVLSSSGSP